MPFPVDEKYIVEMEQSLSIKFPEKYVKKMLIDNGGEVIIDNISFGQYSFRLFPFYDKSDRKRIKRTCNHIEAETKKAREWIGFPDDAIAIGDDGLGNCLILLEEKEGILGEALYFWNHEGGEIEMLANNIGEVE